MAEQKQLSWVLTYRTKQQSGTKFIKARDVEWAERVGRKWCESQGDGLHPVRFVKVEPLYVAGEEILTPEPPPEPAKVMVPAEVQKARMEEERKSRWPFGA